MEVTASHTLTPDPSLPSSTRDERTQSDIGGC
jgi:hypothetical protein